MNKTKKGALGAAGVGVVALAMFGGGTFAYWSDFDKITGNETEAGHLVLDLNGTDPISNVEGRAIAPGEHRTTDFFVASADLDGVPSASLSFNVQNLEDKEDGCPSNSEKAADESCNESDEDGEFVDQAYVKVSYNNPSFFGAASCLAGELVKFDHTLVTTLDDLADPTDPTKLADNLTSGKGVCVRFEIGLPYEPDIDQNASQGDSATFDIQWDLTQNTPADYTAPED